MEDLTQYTPTQLLKMVNDTNTKHEQLKAEVITHTFEIDGLEVLINNKLKLIAELEKNYIDLIEEMNNR